MNEREALHPDAYALRPARLITTSNTIRLYEAITFPQDPRGNIEMWLRRAFLFDGDGLVAGLLIDILDKEGDIIQEYEMSRQGFRYLLKRLKISVDWGQ